MATLKSGQATENKPIDRHKAAPERCFLNSGLKIKPEQLPEIK
jgi:hypothetical protein